MHVSTSKKSSNDEPEPLPQTPVSDHPSTQPVVADEAPTAARHASLIEPTPYTTVEPVAGSEGPRSQKEIDEGGY
jgi:hypothetical protein